MAELGMVLGSLESGAQNVIVASTVVVTDADLCEIKPKECFNWGSLIVNGVEQPFVGTFALGTDATLKLHSRRSFGRASLTSPQADLDIDFVPAPLEWQLNEESAHPDVNAAQYSHLNLKLKRAVVSDMANGIIGCSIRLKQDSSGRAIMSAYDKDGAGILEAPVAAYEVESLDDTSFPLYSLNWSNQVDSDGTGA